MIAVPRCGLLVVVAVLAGCGPATEQEPSAATVVEPEGPLFGTDPAPGLDLRVRVAPREVELFGEVHCWIDLFESEAVATERGEASVFAPVVPADFVGSFGTSASKPIEGGTWTRFHGVLRPTALEDLAIPPFRFEVGEAVATTPEVLVVVASALESVEADAAQVEAPAPLFPERVDVWPIVAAIGGGLVLLLGAFWWWRRRRALRAAGPDAVRGTPLPPHIAALRALGRLRSAPRETPQEVEGFYVDVSQILRTYLEGRFGLQAPERTTEEFLPEVERSGLLNVTQRAHLRQFLEQCDLVKFAAVRPNAEVHEGTFSFAEDFVESTRPERQAQEVAAS